MTALLRAILEWGLAALAIVVALGAFAGTRRVLVGGDYASATDIPPWRAWWIPIASAILVGAVLLRLIERVA